MSLNSQPDSSSKQKYHPSWSVMIPTYNSTDYLESTLSCVMTQDPGPDRMQIEIIDDCSPNETANAILAKLNLTQRVGYFRQPQNLGLAKNWNACIDRAKGEFVHILHQDDLVFPGFYQKFEEVLLRDSSLGAAYCRHQFLDDEGQVLLTSRSEQDQPGIIPDFLDRIVQRQIIQTPSIVVPKKVYTDLGGFRPELLFTLDWEMWTRIASRYPVWYFPDVLAAYRVHLHSESRHLEQTGETIEDFRRFFEIRNSYLPKSKIAQHEIFTKRAYAKDAFRRAFILFEKREGKKGYVIIKNGLRLRSDTVTIKELVRLTLKYFFGRINKSFPTSYHL